MIIDATVGVIEQRFEKKLEEHNSKVNDTGNLGWAVHTKWTLHESISNYNTNVIVNCNFTNQGEGVCVPGWTYTFTA